MLLSVFLPKFGGKFKHIETHVSMPKVSLQTCVKGDKDIKYAKTIAKYDEFAHPESKGVHPSVGLGVARASVHSTKWHGEGGGA